MNYVNIFLSILDGYYFNDFWECYLRSLWLGRRSINVIGGNVGEKCNRMMGKPNCDYICQFEVLVKQKETYVCSTITPPGLDIVRSLASITRFR